MSKTMENNQSNGTDELFKKAVRSLLRSASLEGVFKPLRNLSAEQLEITHQEIDKSIESILIVLGNTDYDDTDARSDLFEQQENLERYQREITATNQNNAA